MAHHNLKCNSKAFQGILAGVVHGDIRYNDRNFRNGDSVTYYEIETTPDAQGVPRIQTTGNTVNARISYVTTFEEYSNYLPGLAEFMDYVVLSIDRVGLMIAEGAVEDFWLGGK